jgi:hypothetical protein
MQGRAEARRGSFGRMARAGIREVLHCQTQSSIQQPTITRTSEARR